MKLLINRELTHRLVRGSDYTDEAWDWECDDYVRITETCDSFTVYNRLVATDTQIDFTIGVQKCTLDEMNMNTLMYEVIDYLWSPTIRYAGLGGRGCDFAFAID